MKTRRTAIVPKLMLGTAVASVLPQVVACGGKTDNAPGPAGGQAGQSGQAGAAGKSGSAGTFNSGGYAGGIIVLAIGAFGGSGSGPAYDAGVPDAMIDGGDAGAAGAQPNDGTAGFWVLAIRGFGTAGSGR